MTTRPLRHIYQLKITLRGIQPSIWRRFQVTSCVSLNDLSNILQFVMGWSNRHRHEYIQGHNLYALIDQHRRGSILDESAYRLEQVLRPGENTLLYLYDYQDTWEHQIELERILPFDVNAQLPICLDGEQACPPESVGGPPGYYYFLEAIADPTHVHYHKHLNSVGGDFDPRNFNLAEVNALLHDHCK